MGPVTVSLRPRLGARALMTALSNSLPPVTPAPSPPTALPTTTNTRTIHHPVRPVPRPGPSVVDHGTVSPGPHWAREKVVRRRRQTAIVQDVDAITDDDSREPSPPDKRRKVTVEEIPDDDAPLRTTRGPPPRNPARRASRVPLSAADRDREREKHLRCYEELYVEEFPDPLAGSPISRELAPPPNMDAYMRACGPMANPDDFKTAELLMTSDMSDANKDRQLKSENYEGNSPWPNCAAMLRDVDKLVRGPEYQVYEIELDYSQRSRTQFMVCCDIIQVIRDFLANPAFKDHVRYKPRRLYTSSKKSERVYVDMADADWWWREMERLGVRGKRTGTIVPLIIATDQTTLSIMCGGQKAYPVYVTFGNLDKGWRRKPSKHGAYLLGYLPVDAFEDVTDDDERRRLKADLVHRAMEKMLEPLRKASVDGVEMWCPDGRKRHIYPRVAAYTADWPEQNLQCCTSEGGCPICKTSYRDRGNLDDQAELREREETLNALRTYIVTQNKVHLDELGLKPVWPWWGDIPDVNLHACVTPDLLHQAYQGLFKTHLLKWLKKLLGVDVLDGRFASMPPAAGLTRFMRGISSVNSSRWTGHQSKQLLAQFLPAVICGLTPEKAQLIRSLVDFMYRAHATSLTESDLLEMDDDLRIFHELKSLLVGPIFKSDNRFNKIAKLHMLRHWTHSIRELGTPDGYNTEGPEHLHIEYAKVPWRASNKVKPQQQMITFIQRRAAIRIHRAILDRYLADDQDEDEEEPEDVDDEDTAGDTEVVPEVVGSVDVVHDTGNVRLSVDPEPVYYPRPSRHMAIKPTVKKITIQEVIDRYHATNMIPAIKSFLTRRCGAARHDVLLSPYNHVSLWHKLALRHPPPSFAPFDPVRRDVIRARPRTRGNPAVWDVALYLEKPNRQRSEQDTHEKHGIDRYRAGRVRAFFRLPATYSYLYDGLLAYVEVFAPFNSSPSPFNKLHSTTPDFEPGGPRRTLVIPVSDIFFACHLVPKYNLLIGELPLHSDRDLLSDSRYFWLNHYYNHHFYRLLQHWRRRRPTLQERLIQNLQSGPTNTHTSEATTEQMGNPDSDGRATTRSATTQTRSRV